MTGTRPILVLDEVSTNDSPISQAHTDEDGDIRPPFPVAAYNFSNRYYL
jgi:hypothetical protein